jgi:hypothetical protein
VRILAALLGLAFVVGAVMTYFWYIAAFAALVLAVRLIDDAAKRGLAREAARRAEDARLIAAADQQHTWVCEGDDRGIYGAPKEEA